MVAVLAAVGAALWTGAPALDQHLSPLWLMPEDSWVEKPASRITLTLTGADMQLLQPLAKKIRSLLAPFDGQVRATEQDSPSLKIELVATVPPPAVLPLHELAKETVDRYQDSIALAFRPARVRSVVRRHTSRPAHLPSRASSETAATRDIRRRQDVLAKSIRQAAADHSRLMTARRQYRHPDELLKNDPEARELKQKLVDLEMTLAEVIDQYTPAHPRTRQIQSDIAAVRSALDRRVTVAEQEEQLRYERQQTDLLNRKRLLDRDEKKLRRAPTPAEPAHTEESEPPAPAVSESAAGSAPAIVMEWLVAEASMRELKTVKKLNIPNVAIVITALLSLSLLVGYALGVFGFSSASPRAMSATPPSGGPPVSLAKSPPVSPVASDLPAAGENPPTAPVSRPPARIRSPLPAVPPPAPPEPEKVLDEKDIPGRNWRSLQNLPAVEKRLYTVFAPTSPSADLFTQMADPLLSSIPAASVSPIVAVSSVRSGAGVSVFAANLAVSLAARRPVVLVDLHPTAPILHEFFSMKPSELDSVSPAPWKQTMVATPIDQLSLLPMFYPHTEKETRDLKLKKRLPAFAKELPAGSLILIDIAPISRSDLFEDVAEVCDVFLLMLGPDPTLASAKSPLKQLSKAMGKKPILRITRTADDMPDALRSNPPAAYEFAARPS